MRPKMLAAVATSALLAGSLLLAQGRGVGGVGITVFRDPGFQGVNATFRDDVSDLSGVHLNDRVSSFRIAPGEFWEVCEHKDFGGRCAVFSGDEPDLRRVSWNDQITSMRRVRRDGHEGREADNRYPDRSPRRRSGTELVLYEDENFRGEARRMDGPEPSLGEFSRRASSLRATGGSWEICDEPDFGGRCASVSGSVNDLRSYGLHDRVMSVRPIGGRSYDRGRSYDGGRPYDGGRSYDRDPRETEAPAIVLYERPGYRGRSVEINGAGGDIDEFNDRAQSVRVIRGTWQVCEHAGFRGRCATLTESTPDLDQYDLRDAVSSARPVVSYRPPR